MTLNGVIALNATTGLITRTLGPSIDFTLLNGYTGKCVSRLLAFECTLHHCTFIRNLPNSVAFRTDYVKVVEDTLSASEMWAKEFIVFNDISLMAILAGHHPSESVK